MKPEEDAALLFPLSTNQESARSVNVRLDNKEITFKLDTRAEVTAISEEAYEMLQQATLQKSSRILYGPTVLHPKPPSTGPVHWYAL